MQRCLVQTYILTNDRAKYYSSDAGGDWAELCVEQREKLVCLFKIFAEEQTIARSFVFSANMSKLLEHPTVDLGVVFYEDRYVSTRVFL